MCDSLHCSTRFIEMVWNGTHNIFVFCVSILYTETLLFQWEVARAWKPPIHLGTESQAFFQMLYLG